MGLFNWKRKPLYSELVQRALEISKMTDQNELAKIADIKNVKEEKIESVLISVAISQLTDQKILQELAESYHWFNVDDQDLRSTNLIDEIIQQFNP